MTDTLKSAAAKRRAQKGMSESHMKRLEALQTESPQQTTVLSSAPVTAASLGSLSYTGISQVPHGLNIPAHDPNAYFPTDLNSVSSPLARTPKSVADSAVQQIEEQRQTVRIRRANINLAGDLVDESIDHVKLQGKAISYATELVKNEQKYIGLQTEGINRDISESRYWQSSERLNHSNIVLSGLRGQTEHIREEWNERIRLSLSKVNDVRIAALKAEDRVRTERASLPVQAQGDLD